MAKDDLLELTGKVLEVLPGNMYRVQLDDNQHILLAYLGGRLKQHKIKIIGLGGIGSILSEKISRFIKIQRWEIEIC